jgi:RNA polymerase sigma-32 factor
MRALFEPKGETMTAQFADRYIVEKAAKAAYLGRDEEHEIARGWAEQKDQRSLHALTTSHMRLVISIAAKFRSYGLHMNDLVQEGHVGLLEAAWRFDPHREVRFSTYATWWIRASIQDFVLRNWSIVRAGTSSKQKALFFKLRALRARIAQQTPGAQVERQPYRTIADAIGVSEDDVAAMDARLAGPDVSLNAPVGNDSESTDTRQDFLESTLPDQQEIVDETIDAERVKQWLKVAVSRLNEREQLIISRRRLTDEVETLESLSKELGVSKERVRQIEGRALQKLKASLLEQNAEIGILL